MLNSETHRYVFRILAIKEIISNHQEYGFIINEDDYYNQPEYYTTNIDSSITNIADFGIKMGLNYKKIKELNPWILGNTITNKDKKIYQLKIISNTKNRNKA